MVAVISQGGSFIIVHLQPCAQSYKTFYTCNLLIFVIS